jgi:hypothetical protein
MYLDLQVPNSHPLKKPQGPHEALDVTVRVLVMLDIYFDSVKYVFVSVKLVCVYVKLLKI